MSDRTPRIKDGENVKKGKSPEKSLDVARGETKKLTLALEKVYEGNQEKIEDFERKSEKELKIQKNIEYDAEKHILAKHLDNVKVENIRQLKKTEEGYSYTDENGHRQEITDKAKLDKIEKDLSSIGLQKKLVPDAIETSLLDHLAEETGKADLKKGIVYDHSYDKQTNQLKVYVVQEVNEAKDGSGTGKIKDGEMKEFSIELKSPEEKGKIEEKVKKHSIEELIINDNEGPNTKFDVNHMKESLSVEGDKYYYTQPGEEGSEESKVRKGKLDEIQKDKINKLIDSLWQSEEKDSVSGSGEKNVSGSDRNGSGLDGIFQTNKDQSGEKSLEELYREGDRIKKQGDRISNFMGFMNIANTVSMQATGNLEVLVDRMLQTEGNPNSMQGMYNPSQYIHDAYNRNIDQKLHANRSEINIRKQELRRNNDGKEGEEKIQKQIEEIGNKARRERNGSNAEQERIGGNAEQERVENNANKKKT
jgi:hypothetical protein